VVAIIATTARAAEFFGASKKKGLLTRGLTDDLWQLPVDHRARRRIPRSPGLVLLWGLLAK